MLQKDSMSIIRIFIWSNTKHRIIPKKTEIVWTSERVEINPWQSTLEPSWIKLHDAVWFKIRVWLEPSRAVICQHLVVEKPLCFDIWLNSRLDQKDSLIHLQNRIVLFECHCYNEWIKAKPRTKNYFKFKHNSTRTTGENIHIQIFENVMSD